MRGTATLAQLTRAIGYCTRWDWSIFTVTSGGGIIDNGNHRIEGWGEKVCREVARKYSSSENVETSEKSSRLIPSVILFE